MLGGFRRVARKVQLLSLRRGVARRCQLARAIPLQPATGAEVDANSYTVPARVERDADGALLAVEADLRAFHVYIIGGKRREHLGKKAGGRELMEGSKTTNRAVNRRFGSGNGG